MSNTDFFGGAPHRSSDGTKVRSRSPADHRGIVQLEQELEGRDLQIAELKTRIILLWGTVFCILLVWALRELLRL